MPWNPWRSGKGLYLEETASAVNCLIENNTATDGGGLFFDHGGYAQDIDSLTNEVDSIGGAGAFLWAGGTLRNGVIEENISTGQYARGGSGILFYDAGGVVDYSVIADNISSTNNGGINFRYSGDTAPSKLGTVNNSIIWGNLPSQTTVWNGTGNQFVDPDTVSGAPTGANVDDYPYDNALTRTTSYYYDLNGNLVKRVYPSRVVETRTFDALNRLLTMKTETLGKSWFKTEYEYDRVGSMLKRSHTRSDSLSGKAFAATTYWTYDSRYRLLSERIYVTGEPSHFTYYTWDNADNRLTKRVFRAIQTENITYTNNALNQITGWYDSLANSGAGKTVSYVYDNNGNRTSKTVTVGGSSTSTTYVYDYDNRLTSTSGDDESAFKYDYRSRRYYRSTPTETNLCVFDGGLCVQEYDASVNLTPHVSRLTTEYLRGPDLGGGVGGMVYSIDHRQSEIGNPIYSHSNHRGDVIARTDGTGSLTWFAIYEAYGTRPFEWGTNLDRQKANTKDEEDELGLLNEGMRYRDLETGTFLTRDPIRYADGPNMYCYVHCNPITSFDAWGLQKEDIITTPEEVAAITKTWEEEKKRFEAYHQKDAIMEKLRNKGTLSGPEQELLYDVLIKGPLTTEESLSVSAYNLRTIIETKGPGFGPGWDPGACPGPGWEWKGKDPAGGKRGNYTNPETGESLHPDLDHEPPIGPHWDYWPTKGGGKIRVDPDTGEPLVEESTSLSNGPISDYSGTVKKGVLVVGGAVLVKKGVGAILTAIPEPVTSAIGVGLLATP